MFHGSRDLSLTWTARVEFMNEPCSIVVTPPSIADMIPGLPWQWAATTLFARCASSTMAVTWGGAGRGVGAAVHFGSQCFGAGTSSMLNSASSGESKALNTPPLVMIFTTSDCRGLVSRELKSDSAGSLRVVAPPAVPLRGGRTGSKTGVGTHLHPQLLPDLPKAAVHPITQSAKRFVLGVVLSGGVGAWGQRWPQMSPPPQLTSLRVMSTGMYC